MLNWLLTLKNIIFPKSKFQRNVSWNVLRFGAIGIGGISLNILLVAIYGAETLGTFNQVYAVYILASQVAVFGLYSSVLKHISQYSEDRILCNAILTSALILTIGIGSLVSFLYYGAVPFIGKLLDSTSVAKGLIFAVFGLWCFSLNKILLSFLNGLRSMKAFALFEACRYLMMPCFLIGLAVLGFPGYASPLIFSLTEFTLLIALLIFSSRFFSFASINQCKKWFKVHLSFGGKSIVGGTVTEMNSRVDALMLGIFSTDRVVGIYSFAAMLAEGFDQIPGIFRVNFNPLLTKFVVSNRLKELHSIIRSFFKKWMPIALMMGLVAAIIFPLIVKIITDDPEFLKGWIVFIILVSGLAVRSGYAVFWELPSQAGYPGYQTILITLVIASNIFLNYLLIPIWGMYGAAVATALSFILSMFYLKVVIKKLLNIAI